MRRFRFPIAICLCLLNVVSHHNTVAAKDTWITVRTKNFFIVGNGGDLTSTDWDWAETYGVTNTGAVLVRPDAFVAWRSPELTGDPDAVISEVLARASGLEV